MSAGTYLKVVTPDAFVRPPGGAVPAEILDAASELMEQVRRGGDAALRELAIRFDGLEPDAPIRFDQAQLRLAAESIPRDQRELLERTAERIERFARAQRSCLVDLDTTQAGARMGHRITPVPSAGCYAPGGRFPLPSSVLMTAVTARAAGVDQVVVASPDPDPIILAAAAVAGADELIAAGGAHAIAALAFGTQQIAACDVIVGPGNAWVTAGKQIVAGRVRIDSLAGPSELLIVVDRASDPAIVAADLLAQAEHDPMAIPALISLDREVLPQVEKELSVQLEDLETADIARAALGNGMAVVVDSTREAVALCNLFAPEHLEWLAADRDPVEDLQHYGGLFIGEGAAEVLGDYGAGPNHVLPTGGSARARGGLSVLDFLKMSTWLKCDDEGSRSTLAADAAALAGIEGLAAHARSARHRG